MRDHGRKIQFKLDGVLRVGVGTEFAAVLPPRVDVGFGITGTTLRAAGSRTLRIRELRHARTQIVYRYLIERKNACERAPLGGHVGNGHARGHWKIRHAVAHEFNGVIEYFVFVEEAAQGDDHVLADDTRRKISFQHDLGDFRDLPPRHSGGPNTGGVGAYNRRPECRHRAVQIGM